MIKIVCFPYPSTKLVEHALLPLTNHPYLWHQATTSLGGMIALFDNGHDVPTAACPA